MELSLYFKQKFLTVILIVCLGIFKNLILNNFKINQDYI